MTKSNLIEKLRADAAEAVRGRSRPLIYRVFGGLNMAILLGAVSYDDVEDIYDYLISGEESRDTI